MPSTMDTDTAIIKDEPRKRSKVSRACDECRRKKIRCNAEYSSTLQRVTKICTSCDKTNETCLFSRVPLKRGPTKGFVRETAPGVESNNKPTTDPEFHANTDTDTATATVTVTSINSNPPTINFSAINPSAFNSNISNNPTALNSSAVPLNVAPATPFATSTPTPPSRARAKAYRPRSKSIDVAAMRYSSVGTAQLTPPSPMAHASGPSRLPSFGPAFAPRLPNGHPILLPPIVGAHAHPHALASTQQPKFASAANCATSNSANVFFPVAPEQHKIHGPIWTVPYEMPASLTPRSSVSSPGGTPATGGYSSRRSSVDSVSSVSTTASARPPAFTHPASVCSASDVDDADSPPSGLVSPRGSVSSMSSLNGKVSELQLVNSEAPTVAQGASSNGFNFSNPAIYSSLNTLSNQIPHQLPHQIPHQVAQQVPRHVSVRDFAPTQAGLPPFHEIRPNPPIAELMARQSSYSFANPQNIHPSPAQSFNVPRFGSSVESNLQVYYAKFHRGFPILPHNERVVLSLVAGRESPAAHLFISSLDHLTHYQSVPFESLRTLLVQFSQVYPFNASTPVENETLILAFAAVCMMNYTMLLRGDNCSLGLSLVNGAFTHVRVLQLFLGSSSEKLSGLGPDDIQLYLPRLLFLTHIMDDCHALSSGGQSIIPRCTNVFLGKLRSTFSGADQAFLENIELGLLFKRIQAKNEEEAFSSSPRSKKSAFFENMSRFVGEPGLAASIIALQRDKYELFDFALEVCGFFKTLETAHFDDEHTKDHVHDYQLKTSRLVKKLSHSILAFADYLSNANSTSSVISQQVSPFLNISFGSALELTKVSKSLIDALVSHATDNETVSRSIKILKDLSMATSLLAGHLNTDVGRVSPKTPNSLSDEVPSGVQSKSFIPGVSAIEAFKRRLEIYGLSFSDTANMARQNAQSSVATWGAEFSKAVQMLLSTESSAGWC